MNMVEGSAAPLREERRTVTVLSADIVGSTALGERLDPEDVRAIIGGAIASMVGAVEDLGGRVKDLAGDGVLALFGAPTAHEDDPERAVRAGLRIIREIRESADALAGGPEPVDVRVRVGIETGLVVLGPVGAGQRVDYGATGDAVNTAARLQSAAVPGTVLVGPRTHRLIEPLFAWGEGRWLALKGKTKPLLAHEATRERIIGQKARGLQGVEVRLVGREREFARGRAAIEGLLDGIGGVLFVIGEAGMGKSRVLREFQALFHASATKGRPRWMEGRCISYGHTLPYWPFQQLLRDHLGTSSSRPPPEPRTALRAELERLRMDPTREVYAVLGNMLGLALEQEAREQVNSLGPETLRHRTFRAVSALFQNLAEEGPLVVVLDDLHWADTSSVQLTESLLSLAANHPVLLVIAARPEPDHPSSNLRERAAQNFSNRTCTINLNALASALARELLDALIGSGTLPEGAALRILQAAEGNPFYLEELVRSLVDARALVRQIGSWRFDHDVPVEIPETVEKVILARIDRLTPRCYEVLTAGSVLGRQFDGALLQEVCGGRLPEGVLEELEERDLIRAEPRASRIEYRFKHALIQEAAYRCLLKSRRRELHLRAAAALERLFPERPEELYGLLAHHYREGGDPEKAGRYYTHAAQAAGRLYAVEEALHGDTSALEMAALLGWGADHTSVCNLYLHRGRVHAQAGNISLARADLELALRGARAASDRATEMHASNELGFLLAGAADYREAIPYLESAHQIACTLGDRSGEVDVLSRLSIVYTNRLQFEGALDHARQALTVARALGSKTALATAMDSLLLAAVMIGDFGTVDQVAPELVTLHQSHGDLWYLQFALYQWCYVAMAAGQWETAFSRMEEALAINRRIGDRGNEPMYLATLCWLHRSRAEYQQALTLGQEAVALAEKLGHFEFTAWSEFCLGWTLLDLFALEESIRHLERGLEASEHAGALNHLVRCASHLAWAHRLAGDAPRAEAMIKRAEEVFRQTTSPPGTAFLQGAHAYVAVGRAYLAQGESARAIHLITPILRAAEWCGWREAIAQGSLILGQGLTLQGDRQAAETALHRALEIASGTGLRGLAWEAHEALASLHAGDVPERAQDHVAQARAIIRDLSLEIEDEGIRRQFLSVAMSRFERV